MNNVTRARDMKIESNQLLFLSKAQPEHHWLKLLGEDIAVTLWFVGENTATTINQTLIFLRETITSLCLLPQQTPKTDCKKFLREHHQNWKDGNASEGVISSRY